MLCLIAGGRDVFWALQLYQVCHAVVSADTAHLNIDIVVNRSLALSVILRLLLILWRNGVLGTAFPVQAPRSARYVQLESNLFLGFVLFDLLAGAGAVHLSAQQLGLVARLCLGTLFWFAIFNLAVEILSWKTNSFNFCFSQLWIRLAFGRLFVKRTFFEDKFLN